MFDLINNALKKGNKLNKKYGLKWKWNKDFANNVNLRQKQMSKKKREIWANL